MTTPSLDAYLGRITPWQSGHPRFTASVRATLAPVVEATAVARSLPSAFDLDDAVGVQLDATGRYIGPDRYVRTPVPGAWFSLDVAGLGYDQGVWKESYSGETAIFALDDETYRRLLYANILARHWGGTVPGAQAAFDAFFVDPATRVFVQDNAQVPYPRAFFALDAEGQGYDQATWYEPGAAVASTGKVDVSMTIGVAGRIPPPLYLGLLAQRAIPIKPGGVQTIYAVTSVDGAALFGFDVQNAFVAGFDTGAIGVDPATLLAA